MSAATPEPSPARSAESRNVLDDLVLMLRERSDFGLRKYGTRLTTHNSRDPHVDALQELLDLFVYLHQAQMERADAERRLAAAEERANRATTLLRGVLPGVVGDHHAACVCIGCEAHRFVALAASPASTRTT